MSLSVAPSTTFEATTDQFAAGSTVGVRIRDNQGNNTLARTTAGVIEDVTVAGACVKRRTFTGIATPGQYVLVWDDGTTIDTEELFVTGDVAAVGGTSNLYVSEAEVKSAADLTGETFANTEIDTVIPAVCRAIDLYKKTRYYPFTATRYYTAQQGVTSQPVYDLNTLTELAVDDGTYAYADVWTADTDFFLGPANAAADGYPYREIQLLRTSTRFPTHLRGIRVTGSHGWAETPAVVKLAATKLAVRELAALKTAPMGLVIATEMAARIGSMYRDIADLLDNLPPRPKTRSVQLG